MRWDRGQKGRNSIGVSAEQSRNPQDDIVYINAKKSCFVHYDKKLRGLLTVGIVWGFIFMLCLGDTMTCQAEIRESSLGEQKIQEIQVIWPISETKKITNTVGMTQGNEEDEDLQDLEGFEDLEEDISDEEIQQILNEYLKNIDEEVVGTESMTSSKVIDPVMEMKPENQKKFRYTLPNGNYFVSSIPNGMISTEAIDFQLPEGTIGLVWKDDVSLAFPESWHFTQKGNYHVRLLILQPPGDMTVDYNIYEVNFYFTIIDRKDNTLGAVPAPNEFVIAKVYLDGKQQEVDQKRCFFLKEDGYYEFQFESLEYEGVLLETAFTRDTKAPFLSFSEEIKSEGVSGPVEFYPSEQGCEIYMNYNGNRGYAVSNSLTAAGSYELTVKDSAGNHRGYHIRIRQTYNLIDKRILVGIAVLGAAAGIRLIFLRRNMKVL